MMKIFPSVLATNKKELVEKLFLVQDFPLVHVDIGDDKFVNNKTIQPIDLLTLKLPPTEFHLMVRDVDHYVEHCVRLNAKTIVFHFEACKNDKDVLHLVRHIKSHGVNAGLAINPETGINKIKKFVKIVDQILVMTVHPGFGGQKFIAKMLSKITALRKPDKKLNIEVDGGINLETAHLAAKAGANFFVVGNAILGAKNPRKSYEELLKTVKKKK